MRENRGSRRGEYTEPGVILDANGVARYSIDRIYVDEIVSDCRLVHHKGFEFSSPRQEQTSTNANMNLLRGMIFPKV